MLEVKLYIIIKHWNTKPVTCITSHSAIKYDIIVMNYLIKQQNCIRYSFMFGDRTDNLYRELLL